MSEELLGTIEGGENRRKVTLRRVFRASISELWSALVEPDRIRAWFAPAKIDLRVGGRIELEAHDGSRMMEGMIRVCEPPRLFEYDWVSAYETTVVRYELEEVPGGTRLTLTEKLLTDSDTERRGAGWQQHVERLEAHLRGEASPPDEARWRRLRELYRARIAGSARVAPPA